MQLLQDHVFERVDEYRRSFQEATPYKHVIVDDFFTPKAWKLLLDEFPAHGSTEGLVGDYGLPSRKGGNSDVTSFGPTYVEWDKLLQSKKLLGWMSEVSGIDDLLYDPDYNGGGIHENFPGGRGNIHIDYNFHPRTMFHRRLNAICYITPGWTKKRGGELRMYEDGSRPMKGDRKTVDCLPNRCVLFETTENSWHGVGSIYVPEGKRPLTRKSIATYFYTEGRPSEQTAERHSTIYYPGTMPQVVRQGKTLTAIDAKEIKGYQRRATNLMRSLYKEQTKLYGRITKLRQANKELRQKIAELKSES